MAWRTPCAHYASLHTPHTEANWAVSFLFQSFDVQPSPLGGQVVLGFEQVLLAHSVLVGNEGFWTQVLQRQVGQVPTTGVRTQGAPSSMYFVWSSLPGDGFPSEINIYNYLHLHKPYINLPQTWERRAYVSPQHTNYVRLRILLAVLIPKGFNREFF